MSEYNPIRPEIQLFLFFFLLYPPLTIVLYEVTPYSYSEALFLQLIKNRIQLDNKDVYVISILEDFSSTLKTSTVRIPVVNEFERIMTSPLVHYRYYDDLDEAIKAIDLHYKDAEFIYIYMSDPTTVTNDDFLKKISEIITKIKLNVSRRLLISFFFDSFIRKTVLGRRIEHQADLVFDVVEREGYNGGRIRLLKSKFYPKPEIDVFYSFTRTGLEFQVMRSLK